MPAGDNNKDARRVLLQNGKASDCWSGLPEESSLRAIWSQPQEFLMEVGDSVQDYDHFTQAGLAQDPAPLKAVLGDKFFLIPNPMYGSWR